MILSTVKGSYAVPGTRYADAESALLRCRICVTESALNTEPAFNAESAYGQRVSTC
jgi:hypothetical protein